MRRDVKKFLFVGADRDRAAFFQRAQKEGLIEFINPSASPVREVPKELQELAEALRILRGLPVVEQEERAEYSQADKICGEILSAGARSEKLHEELRVLRLEIARVQPFGDFDLQDLEYLKERAGRQLQFFASKQQAEVDTTEWPEVVRVNSANGLDYYIALNREPKQYEGMIEMKVDQPVGTLHHRFGEVEKEIQVVEEQLKGYAKESDFLHEALRDRLNQHQLEATTGHVELVLNDRVFTVAGWVAEHQIETVSALANEMHVSFDPVAVEESDHVPTYLENHGFARIGEDLVHIYDTPSVEDRDPSTWVLWSFALFFAIILGDGGYGVIFLLLSLFLWMRFPKLQGMGRRVLKLSTILSISCIGWGLFTNSFFGISFDLESGVRQISGLQWLVEQKADYHFAMKDAVFQDWAGKYSEVATATSGYGMLEAATMTRDGKTIWTMLDKFADGIMLEMALLIGVIHITLSLLRSIRESWAGIGWVAFMVGGYLYVPDYLNCTSMAQFLGGLDKSVGAEVGMQLLLAGLGAAVVLAIIQQGLGGAGEIINVIQVFADVLSYLRLYALGLAGSMMSSTFNDIGSSAPFVAGFFIILIGHIVNIVLSIMGGVIHGLRLNFLEWYHYSFEGGGKMFRPLQLIKVKETS